VFLATPVIRTVARIELPSTRAEATRQRVSVSSRFILTIILDDLTNVKQKGNFEKTYLRNALIRCKMPILLLRGLGLA
jgi:hypothetical protein